MDRRDKITTINVSLYSELNFTFHIDDQKQTVECETGGHIDWFDPPHK